MFITTMNSDNKVSSFIKKFTIVTIVSSMLLASVSSVAALNKTAVINVDGKQLEMATALSSDVDDILANAGVNLSSDDVVTATDKNGLVTVNVERAFEVCLDNNGKANKYMIAGGTVADLVQKAGVMVTENHIVIPAMNTKLTADMTVTVKDKKIVNLNADGIKDIVKVPSGTVKEALDYLEIKLGKNDKINCKLTDNIADNMDITITRVEYKNVKTVEKIPFETIETYTDELAEGKKKIVAKGVDGEITTVTKQKLVNGKVTEEELVSTEVTKEPVSEEMIIGTKTSKKATATKATSESSSDSKASADNDNVIYDENGNEVVYTSVLHGSGTAYCAEPGALTASGEEVFVGGVAVNPNIIPLGTKLYIVADDGYVYGYATAVDTGGALMDGSALVDLFYFSYDQCIEFGRRDVSVYILE
ncbi:MAG: ubiquitin-like domain-containing protein [Acutalibacteraceae bacterium]|nr:ubiquitin-like domain-containing protein [Acutalibacteraceae bacterium]